MNYYEIIISLSTASIAVIAAIIAYQQFKLGKNKYKFELFEKRFAVFLKFREFVLLVNQEGETIKIEEIQRFIFQTLEYKFLFNPELVEYINDFLEKVKRLRTINVELKNPQNENSKEMYMKELEVLTFWFTDQFENIEGRFQIDLSIKD